MKQLILLLITIFSINICTSQTNYKDSLDSSKKIKKIGIKLLHDGKHLSAVNTFKHSIAVLPKNAKDQKIELFYLIGNSFYQARVNDSSEYYFKEVDKLCDETVTNDLKSKKYKSRAYIFMNNKISDKAMNYFLKALDYAKLTNNKKLIAGIYSDIGSLFLNDQNLRKAEEYFNKSHHIGLQSNDSLIIAYSLIHIGTVAFFKKNYKTAEKKHRKALTIFEKIACKKGMFLSKVSISKALYFQGNFEEPAQLSLEAISLLNEMEFGGKMKKLVDNTKGLTKMTSQLNSLDSLTTRDSTNLISKTRKIFNENLNISKKEGVAANSEVLGLFKYKENDDGIFFSEEEFSEELKNTIIKRDSIFQKSLDSKYAELETKYKTQEKEKQNLQLQNEATQRELVLAKENKQKWIFALSLLGALFALGVFMVFYRRNRKQKRFIEYLQTEMHHRVKNNLSIINAFIDNANDADIDIDEKLLDLQNRIDSIYHIHEQLCKSNDVTQLNLKNYIDTLSTNVKESFLKDDITIANKVKTNFDINPEKSFAIGMIINEFLTNSFKHAFTKKDTGTITIDIKKDKNAYYLSLQDNGKGLPANIDIKKLESYGLKIISLLVKQLKGSFLLENNDGLSLTVKFPKS